jgi:hypothetical protein
VEDVVAIGCCVVVVDDFTVVDDATLVVGANVVLAKVEALVVAVDCKTIEWKQG